MSRVPLTLIAGLSFASVVSAQSTLTIPPTAATKAGNSLSRDLGLDQIRVLTYVDNSLIRPALFRQVKEVRCRRDEAINKVFGVTQEPMTRRPARNTIPIPTWRMFLGNYPGRMSAIPSNYRFRNGPAMTLLFNSQLSLTNNTPNLALPDKGLPKFEVRFPLNSNFFLAGPNLAIEHFAGAQRNVRYNYYIDAVQTEPSSGRGGEFDIIGPTTVGCPPGANRVVGHVPNPGAGNMRTYLFGAQPNKTAAAVFGLTQQTVSLRFMALKTCNLYTDLTYWFYGTTNAQGRAVYETAVPGSNTFLGLTLYHQWLVADDRVNKVVGFATSDGIRAKAGTRIGGDVVRMTQVAGEGFYAQRGIGFVTEGRGHVFQLIY